MIKVIYSWVSLEHDCEIQLIATKKIKLSYYNV